ncbi:hypothetical protein COT44_00525 [Candidatus Shapirobacteria bacterium CG08_land_8_20_14_0_20_39_18]|uniref:50S ribosomal protein L17 n=1 Tax=Candidatus Shapirobacteria bacterium CG08_land_8_20_14_0_20_39_18 TaxID=1974883 RepID=A0A2M6XEA8_9BACT|nr:MAG: hypothetical protein COT44_00525 [Candidatus Shapirobacteria bacterium CG08_land_8_20_14_0_20_39_18]PIY66430.1 MAG: hypothetical protein COY91_00615 [Candidatus Shapirobacteria bacterium CG_4_10_14_0_8_um_filter_39_15]PJE68402.1 MAG: hypothetical protein COU94_02025 [Candidatus Shapirobacteria bacterium CG10_big_fil_rev_8_21_14_0_10_38_8]
MRHGVFGRKLSRDANERKSLFKNLTSSLLTCGHIVTTESKAKAIKGLVDKLVKKSGSTRIIRLGTRLGDRAMMVKMELVEKEDRSEKLEAGIKKAEDGNQKPANTKTQKKS